MGRCLYLGPNVETQHRPRRCHQRPSGAHDLPAGWRSIFSRPYTTVFVTGTLINANTQGAVCLSDLEVLSGGKCSPRHRV